MCLVPEQPCFGVQSVKTVVTNLRAVERRRRGGIYKLQVNTVVQLEHIYMLNVQQTCHNAQS